MRIETSRTIAAPAETVFRRLADVDRLTRQAEKRGALVRRTDGGTELAVGATWDVTFRFRGRSMQGQAEVVRLVPPREIGLLCRAGGVEVPLSFTVTALPEGASRLDLLGEAKGTTLPGRLLVQSVALGRGALTQRVETWLAGFAERVESLSAGPRSGGARRGRRP